MTAPPPTSTPADAGESAAKLKPDHRASSWWVPGGMLVAAAAAILLWWVWPPSEDVRGPQLAQLEPLPTYSLEVDGGLAQLRGEEPSEEPAATEPARYQRNTQFSWQMRPELEVGEPVSVRGFVFASGGSAGLPLALDALTQRAASGVLRVFGEISSLDLEPGRYTIVLAVGRPDDLPTQAAQVASPKPEDAWQVHRVEIIIED